MSRSLEQPFEFSLNESNGVPVYRQIIDQIQAGIASGRLVPGAQLPTVRQVAVGLEINSNTVLRAYRELEIRGVLATQQGIGTFIADRPPERDEAQRDRVLDQLISEFVARAGAGGFTLKEVMERLRDLLPEAEKRRE